MVNDRRLRTVGTASRFRSDIKKLSATDLQRFKKSTLEHQRLAKKFQFTPSEVNRTDLRIIKQELKRRRM